MQRVTYAALTALLIAALVMTACGQSVPDRAALDDTGGIVRITFSRVHSGAEYPFIYSIYQLGEAYYFADGTDGDARDEDGAAADVVNVGSREVTEQDMANARELAAQYGMKSYLEAYKPPLIDLGGEGEYRTELELDDGTVLAADTAGTWQQPLEHFFKELELRYAGEAEK